MASGYHLCVELDPIHADDVKAVIAVGDHTIVSASRDGSVGVWGRAQGQSFRLQALLGGHDAYVNSLAHIPHGAGNGFIASGGNSSLILLHSLDTLNPEPAECLIGHSLNVCTLTYSPSLAKLVSASWDHTARVWSETDGHWDTELVLQGHSEAVWGVTVVETGVRLGCYITGSADRTIILWSQRGETLQCIKGSPEPVRSLAMLPESIGFASACNDGLLRLWDLSGNIIRIIRGHTDYVYEVIIGPRGQVISCGEDHTTRIWTDAGDSLGVLLHPCQTVWAVASLANEDLITAGSDGKLRIWTISPERMASDETLRVYNSSVDAAISAKQQVQTDVPPEPGSHVIDIDINISDDAPPLVLSYRPESDPRQAAEEFGTRHALSANYVDQIEEFIRLHTSRG
ncbi:WD40-repeat-containing domain protein [Naematelia encephala]|uniref:WD40-repeat-containing domain protein n=1 Tax=Naematelia encephala TaxID=71784 RepID=A0A1Y2AUM3_9TREE|nr:WD40-repeat-containing domain protein [Naematelia encephala]